MSQPEYIMLVGLPGTGKSTWVKSFLADNPKEFEIVSSDDIIEEYGLKSGLNYSEAFKEYAKDAMKEMNKRLHSYIKGGKNIIHDQTNTSAKSRMKKLKSVPSDYRKVAVVFKVDDDTLQTRLSERAMKTGKFIPKHVLRNMSEAYSDPTTEEGFHEIRYVE